LHDDLHRDRLAVLSFPLERPLFRSLDRLLIEAEHAVERPGDSYIADGGLRR